jgi:hypothetical protein
MRDDMLLFGSHCVPNLTEMQCFEYASLTFRDFKFRFTQKLHAMTWFIVL